MMKSVSGAHRDERLTVESGDRFTGWYEGCTFEVFGQPSDVRFDQITMSENCIFEHDGKAMSFPEWLKSAFQLSSALDAPPRSVVSEATAFPVRERGTMKLADAQAIVNILSTADGGCPVCVDSLIDDFLSAFPEFAVEETDADWIQRAEWSDSPEDGKRYAFYRVTPRTTETI